MSKTIGEDSLEALLAEFATEGDNGGLSLREIAKRAGRSDGWALKRLNELNEAGRLICGQRPGIGLGGKRKLTPVYRIKPL